MICGIVRWAAAEAAGLAVDLWQLATDRTGYGDRRDAAAG